MSSIYQVLIVYQPLSYAFYIHFFSNENLWGKIIGNHMWGNRLRHGT